MVIFFFPFEMDLFFILPKKNYVLELELINMIHFLQGTLTQLLKYIFFRGHKYALVHFHRYLKQNNQNI